MKRWIGGLILTLCITGASFAQTITTAAGGYIGDGNPATQASLNQPEDVFIDGSGNIYIADTQNNRVRKVSASGTISTVAGTGIAGSSGDGGPATSASLYAPASVFVDGSGNLYIADAPNGRVRKVDTSGNISTVAGGGTYGVVGDGGPATAAYLAYPNGLHVDASGNIYIADYTAHRVRKVNAATGIITTVAGNGTSGFSGDGGAATSANLNQPRGVSVDGSGNIYIADFGNNRVRKVDTSGNISTVAGGGSVSSTYGDGGPATSAYMNQPRDVFVDGSGNLFIAEWGNARIRKVNTSGTITTVAGGGNSFADGGPATSTSLNGPQGVYVDGSGNIFIADWRNDRIRKVSASGTITTVAGGFIGDGNPATQAVLKLAGRPVHVFVDGSGNLYIPDSENNRIRKVNSSGVISTVAGNGFYGTPGDGGPATSANVYNPSGVHVDAAGNLYISEVNGFRVRKVNASGVISTVAGGNGYGFSGDGGPATSAQIGNANDVFVDGPGNIYIVTSDNRVRKVDVSGNISTVAGTGTGGFSGDGGPATSAKLNQPEGLYVDGAGNLYIADTQNNRIRKVDTSGNISTVAGGGSASSPTYGDGGAATSASLNNPSDIAVDGAGNLYIADKFSFRIRKVDAATGVITSVAGSGGFGFSGDGGPATSAKLYYPTGLAFDSSGNLYIADTQNNRIRKLIPPTITETTAAAGLSGATSADQGNEGKILSIGLMGDSTAVVSGITVTISDLSTATGLVKGDFSQVRVYRSADATLDGSDTQLGYVSQASINIGSPTTITVSDIPPGGIERFYIVSAILSSGATTGHAFKVGFAAGGVATTNAGNKGTAVTASDANRVTVVVQGTSPPPPSPIGQNVWSGAGPEGGNIQALAIAPSNAQAIYVGSDGWVFKSTNGGSSWSAATSGLPAAQVNALAVDPSNAQTVYAGTTSGTFKSTDGGSSWTQSGTLYGSKTFVFDPSNSQTVYAGTYSGVFKSTDGGTSWTAANSGLTNTSVYALAIGPSSSQTLYAGTYGGGVFKSANGGTSWTAANSGLTDTNVQALVIDPSNAQTLYAGTTSGGVFKSTDGGGSWTAVSSGLTYINVLAIAATSPQTLYAIAGGNLRKTTNGGGAWSAVGSLPTGVFPQKIAVDPSNAQIVYVGSPGRGVFKSTDGGGTWTAVNSGLAATTVLALAIDPASAQNVDPRFWTIYAGTFDRGFKSTNGGGSWTALNFSAGTSTNVGAIAIDPSNPQTVYAGSYGIFKSTNGGGSWTSGSTGGFPFVYVSALVIDPSSTQTVYAGTNGQGVFKTANGGTSWTAVNSGLTNTSVNALAIDPSSSQTVYAGTSGGVFKSTNGGTSWTAFNSGLANTSVSALAIDPSSSQTVYAGTSGGVFKSTNGGTSWTAVNSGLTSTATVWSLAIDPSSSQTVYAGTSGGVFKSANGGTSWTAFNSGLIAANIRALAIDSSSPQTIFAGTYGGGVSGITITGTPAISLSATSVVLDSANVGTTTQKTFTISNTGDGALSVTGITVGGTDAALFTVSPTAASVAVSGSRTVTVTFAPTSAGTKSASLSIAHNAAGSPSAVTLSGKGHAPAPAIGLSATSVVFDSTKAGTTAQKAFTVSNTGDASLSVTGITVSGTDAALFTVSPTTASVAAGAVGTVTVTFAPTAAGTRSASLSIAHNATGSPSAVTLSGKGHAPVVTPSGTNVPVQPVDATTGVSTTTMTFSNVVTPGETNLRTTTTAPALPSGFQLPGSAPVYYDITTSAVFSGSVDVCINYTGISVPDETKLNMLHYEGNAWKDVTTSRDTVNNVICGSVTTLSPFAIAQVTISVPTPVTANGVTFQRGQTAATLAWNAAAGAVSYTLEYADNSGFTGSTTVTGITATQYTPTLSDGTYYWRVKTVGSSGESGFSSTYSFTIIPTFTEWTVILLASAMIVYMIWHHRRRARA